ncbi:MAG: amidohydrolase family protein [Oligoflexus sp.]
MPTKLHKKSGALLLLSSLALSSTLVFGSWGNPDSKQKTYLGQKIKSVDIHMHPGRYETMGPIGKAFLRETLPAFLPKFLKDFSLSAVSGFMLNPYGAFIGIKSECEKAGLTHCGLFAVYAPETWGVTNNEQIISYLDDRRNVGPDQKPYFFGLASLGVMDWQINEEQELQRLRQALAHPQINGIKLAFIHNSIPLDDSQYDSIYRLAGELQAPVYHHVGSSPLRNLDDMNSVEEKEFYLRSYDPKGLERSIREFPQVKFILGHMGFDFNEEGNDFSKDVFDLAETYPNVYLEISAFGRESYDPQGDYMDDILIAIKEKNLLQRTIFGSDGPGFPGGTEKYITATLESMERVGYSFEEAEQVLYHNSAQLFRLP